MDAVRIVLESDIFHLIPMLPATWVFVMSGLWRFMVYLGKVVTHPGWKQPAELEREGRVTG